ncbi:MAG: IS66 family transposase zinc-finger binding domain-containing protein [Actinomycetota bacterium]|nr:IS66 family transposase zinc-finger binding domain-containing protein [Actinomycetota bacterium]
MLSRFVEQAWLAHRTGAEPRQVFDLPDQRVDVTEHVAERRRCRCGAETKADFPPEATGPACFGPAVRETGVYLLVRQHVPVARAAEVDSDLCRPVCPSPQAGCRR